MKKSQGVQVTKRRFEDPFWIPRDGGQQATARGPLGFKSLWIGSRAAASKCTDQRPDQGANHALRPETPAPKVAAKSLRLICGN